MPNQERSELHRLIADLWSLLDPEAHPELAERAYQVLAGCDKNTCVSHVRARHKAALALATLAPPAH